MKESGILIMPGDADMGQHSIPINKPRPQEFFCSKKGNTSSNMHTINNA